MDQGGHARTPMGHRILPALYPVQIYRPAAAYTYGSREDQRALCKPVFQYILGGHVLPERLYTGAPVDLYPEAAAVCNTDSSALLHHCGTAHFPAADDGARYSVQLFPRRPV